MRAKVVTDMN